MTKVVTDFFSDDEGRNRMFQIVVWPLVFGAPTTRAFCSVACEWWVLELGDRLHARLSHVCSIYLRLWH